MTENSNHEYDRLFKSLESIDESLKNFRPKPKKFDYKSAVIYSVIGITAIILLYFLSWIFESF